MLDSLLRWFSPFRLMKDVSRGTREERIAAYRYNRRMRGELLFCMRRWALSLGVAILLTAGFDSLGEGARESLRIFVYLAAVCATFVAFAVCVLFVTAYVYLYLAQNDQ